MVAPTFALVGEQATATDVTAAEVVRAMVVEPDLVESCVEVAVMVAVPEAGALTGAV